MTRPVELQFDFVARYEVTVLDRIDRMPDFRLVLSFPDAIRVDSHRSWAGRTSAHSVFVGGGACVVRSDDPAQTFEIDCWPICDVLVIPDRELVVFGDFTTLIAYGRDGIAWRSKRLALDELKTLRASGDMLQVSGFAGGTTHPVFTVDLRTGESADKPYDFGY